MSSNKSNKNSKSSTNSSNYPSSYSSGNYDSSNNSTSSIDSSNNRLSGKLGSKLGKAGSIIMNLEILQKKYEVLMNQYNQAQSEYSNYLSQYPPGNYIINGNFSQPIITNNSYVTINSSTEVPNWDFKNAILMNNTTALGYPTPYPNGNQSVSIPKKYSISQTVNMNAGTYTLNFMACGSSLNSPNSINVELNGTTIYNFKPKVGSWTNYTTLITIDGSGNNTSSGSNTIKFVGTSSSDNDASAIQNIMLIYRGFTSNPRSTFLGTGVISHSQESNINSCIASCSASSKCTGATYNSDQQLCTLNSGEGNVIRSATANNYSIVPENLKYLSLIKNLNQQLISVNNQISSYIKQGKPIYNQDNSSLQMSSANLNKSNTNLMNDRKKIEQLMHEFELLNAEQNNSDIYTSSHYTIFIFLFIIAVIFIILLCGIYISPSTSTSNTSSYNYGSSQNYFG